jgi:hypothetical protein
MNTKKILGSVALALGLLTAHMGAAQAPAGAPAGSTALCNDGTYFKGSVKIGACTGHKGVKTWWGAAAAKPAAKPAPAAAAKPAAKSAPAAAAKPASTPAPAAAAKPASTPAPAAAPAAAKTTSKTTTQAPGGGPGLVWLNTSSNVYHCPGTQYYGKTKAGSYMSESDAKAKGAHSEGGKPCK